MVAVPVDSSASSIHVDSTYLMRLGKDLEVNPT
jgi:hypothetical protein